MVMPPTRPSLEMAVPYLPGRISPGWLTVKSSDQHRIHTLLLAFCLLDKRQQDAFLEAINAYLFASPRQRERLRRLWMPDRGEAVACGYREKADTGT